VKANIRILTLDDAALWQAALERAPGGCEPFFQPAFYAVSQRQVGGTPECFVFEADGEIAVYPYLRRRLNTLRFLPSDSPLCDITGGYGYNGAVASSDNEGFLRCFRDAFRVHCEATHVLTEFVRFHPLLRNSRFFAPNCTIEVQNQNVAVNLRRPLPEIRAGYEYSCRKNINKAEREGVRTFIEEGLEGHFDEFLRIYRGTMARVGAGQDYAFARAYFEQLAEVLNPPPVFVYAEYRGRIVSCEMALCSPHIIYSYLGGTDADAFPVRPNNALKDDLIRWAHEAGREWYLMGGGSRPGDGIFRYKRTFALDGVVDFEIGRCIYNPTAYEEVICRWQASSSSRGADNTRLQCYWE